MTVFAPILIVILATLFTLLILLASSGNLLVCVAIFVDRKLRKGIENLFLISLACSDLLVAILVMIYAAANDLLGYWPFGEIYCKLWMSFDITLCTASILNLCAVSFDRYFHISSPMIYNEFVTRKRISLIIIGLWILSVAIGFIPLTFDKDIDRLSTENSSTLIGCEFKLKPVFAIISSVLSFFLPTTVMVLAYGRLYLYARRHVKCIKSQLAQAAESLLHQTSRLSIPEVRPDDGGDGSPVKNSRKQEISDQKARITLGVIMGTFLVCWLPFFCINIARSVNPALIPHWLFVFVTWLGYANSTANPIIYSIFNRDFRRAFKRILIISAACIRRKVLRKSFDEIPEFSSVIPPAERSRVHSTTLGERTPMTTVARSPRFSRGQSQILFTYSRENGQQIFMKNNNLNELQKAPMAVISSSEELTDGDTSDDVSGVAV